MHKRGKMPTEPFKTLEWREDRLLLLDQRLLPTEEVYRTYDDYLSVARAIETMVVRGAPAIGVTAAFGVALGALGIVVKTYTDFEKRLATVFERLARTRPTAVNLFWALQRMKKTLEENKALPIPQLQQRLKQEAIAIWKEDIETNKAIGRHGATLLKDGMTVETHCNAGALATAGFGTALGVIYAATMEGKKIRVVSDETRPVLQGSRLTTWELQKNGIEVTMICDNMAGSFMQEGKIDCVIVGADRIAANGDVVNKIGTYPLAILAQYHKIPFYVAAPLSTVDLTMNSAKEIPIEERKPEEVTHIKGYPIAPAEIKVANPAFDRTPHELVTAIITEKGIARAPFGPTLKEWKTV